MSLPESHKTFKSVSEATTLIIFWLCRGPNIKGLYSILTCSVEVSPCWGELGIFVSAECPSPRNAVYDCGVDWGVSKRVLDLQVLEGEGTGMSESVSPACVGRAV